MPSKASEWAKLASAASLSEVGGFEIVDVVDGFGPNTYTLHAGVGRRNDLPTVSITDNRLGGIHLSASQALDLARWILDTFGEAP